MISVDTGAGALSMLRCPTCGGQVWSQDGQVVERDAAFAHLAEAFQGTAAVAHEARRSTAADSQRRRLARERASNPVQGRAAEEPAARATSDLADLLSGWKVLGASV